MTNTEYIDNLVLLANVPVQVESLLHSLEWAVESIDLYVNTNTNSCLLNK